MARKSKKKKLRNEDDSDYEIKSVKETVVTEKKKKIIDEPFRPKQQKTEATQYKINFAIQRLIVNEEESKDKYKGPRHCWQCFKPSPIGSAVCWNSFLNERHIVWLCKSPLCNYDFNRSTGWYSIGTHRVAECMQCYNVMLKIDCNKNLSCLLCHLYPRSSYQEDLVSCQLGKRKRPRHKRI